MTSWMADSLFPIDLQMWSVETSLEMQRVRTQEASLGNSEKILPKIHPKKRFSTLDLPSFPLVKPSNKKHAKPTVSPLKPLLFLHFGDEAARYVHSFRRVCAPPAPRSAEAMSLRHINIPEDPPKRNNEAHVSFHRNLTSWNPKQPFKNGWKWWFPTISYNYKDWVHHPIDSQPFISMVGCKGFQVAIMSESPDSTFLRLDGCQSRDSWDRSPAGHAEKRARYIPMNISTKSFNSTG